MFNKFSAFRDKLTHAQAKRLAIWCSLFTGIILVLIIFTVFYCLIPAATSFPISFLAISLVISSPAMLMSYHIIFAPHFWVLYKQLGEENEKAMKKMIEEFNLTKENYTKVNYSFEEILKGVPNKDVCLAILTDADYSFYVKLTYDSRHAKDALELIVKDVNENIVYQTISFSFRIWEKLIQKV